MDCQFCGKEMKLVESYDNPDVGAGTRLYQCPDHPHSPERISWYAPYIPLICKHPSHSLLDVSDISLTVDTICRYCNLKDDALYQPCTMNPHWMVTI